MAAIRAASVRVHGRTSADARCGYCHDAQRGALVECPRCGVVLHADCRAPLDRCMTLGCSSLAATPSEGASGPAEVYRPRASWFDLRDPSFRQSLWQVIGGTAAAAAFLALFLGTREVPGSLAAVLNGPWWTGFALTIGSVLALGVHGTAHRWRAALRIVAITGARRRFVTLARTESRGWQLHLRARREDISPAEVWDILADLGAPSPHGWVSRVAPHTPMTAHGLDGDGAQVALVDAEGRLHLIGPIRRVDVSARAARDPV